jgi:hypothetical protein
MEYQLRSGCLELRREGNGSYMRFCLFVLYLCRKQVMEKRHGMQRRRQGMPRRQEKKWCHKQRTIALHVEQEQRMGLEAH